jgi:hypothetical protein
MNKTLTKSRPRIGGAALKKFSSARRVPAQAARTAPAK